jgi:hypothetical protein
VSRRARFLAVVERNVARHGYHLSLVQRGHVPRFLYTLGLARSRGAELVLAGVTPHDAVAAANVIAAVAARRFERGETVRLAEGAFRLRRVAQAWTRALLLGIPDFHEVIHRRAIPPVLQLVPQGGRTLDVPNMAVGAPTDSPIRRWWVDAWPGPIAGDAKVVSRLGFLRGDPALEVVRVAADEWHLRTEPDEPEDRVQVCSITTAIGLDPTLERLPRMRVGQVLRRTRGAAWRTRRSG